MSHFTVESGTPGRRRGSDGVRTSRRKLFVVLGAIVAIAVTAAFGWSQDAFLWKPLRKRRMGLNQMMIVSIGFSIVMRYVYLLFFNGDTKDISGGANDVALGPIKTTDVTLYGMVISLAALVGVALFLTRTRIGKATRAVSDNAALASATGIDVERIIRIVWVVAAALTGLAGEYVSCSLDPVLRSDLVEVIGEVLGGTRLVRTVHGGDGQVRKGGSCVECDNRSVVPLGDLASKNFG